MIQLGTHAITIAILHSDHKDVSQEEPEITLVDWDVNTEELSDLLSTSIRRK